MTGAITQALKALEMNEAKFDSYVLSHMSKGTKEGHAKAETNIEMALLNKQAHADLKKWVEDAPKIGDALTRLENAKVLFGFDDIGAVGHSAKHLQQGIEE